MTPLEFVTRLVTDVVEMTDIFANDVIASDPINALLALFGALFIGIASLVFVYCAVGGLVRLTGLNLPRPGRGQSN